MDSSIKAIINVFLMFVSLIILLSCVTFFIAYNHATSVLYAATQDVEIYGNDVERINALASSSNTTIAVSPIEASYGYRYNIQVSFRHVFAFLNASRSVVISCYTRMFEY